MGGMLQGEKKDKRHQWGRVEMEEMGDMEKGMLVCKNAPKTITDFRWISASCVANNVVFFSSGDPYPLQLIPTTMAAAAAAATPGLGPLQLQVRLQYLHMTSRNHI